MFLFDTHCHIDSPQFNSDREFVLAQAQANGIERIIVPATTQRRWANLIKICEASPVLYPALGLHPVYLGAHKKNDIDLLESKLPELSIVAIGEIGLDYYLKELDKSKQLKLLEPQLSIANNEHLPVILHCRKAYDDLIRQLLKFKLPGGIAHAFNGSIQHAYKLIDLGFKLGFGGMLTYERSSKLRTLVAELPLSSIVLETDSPDLTVAQHRGKRNSPAYLPFVLDVLSEIRDESKEEITTQIYSNSLQVFSM